MTPSQPLVALLASGSTTTAGQAIQVILTGIAALVAFAGVAWQLRRQRHTASVERTIALHRDLTTGEVGAARDRFTEYMWRVGAFHRQRSCHQPTFFELLGPVYADPPSTTLTEWLHEYPVDIGGVSTATPLRDLYKVLWCFERVGAALDAGLLDKVLFRDLLAHHAFWWDSLCVRIEPDDTRHRFALRHLSDASEQQVPDLRTWVTIDFPGVAAPDSPPPTG